MRRGSLVLVMGARKYQTVSEVFTDGSIIVGKRFYTRAQIVEVRK